MTTWEHVWHSYPVQLTGAIGCVGTMDPRGTDVTLRLQERPPRRSMQGEPWYLLSFRVFSHWENIFSWCLPFEIAVLFLHTTQTTRAKWPIISPPLETAYWARGLTYLLLILSPDGRAPLAQWCAVDSSRRESSSLSTTSFSFINVINIIPPR